jgi:hypothetical protein
MSWLDTPAYVRNGPGHKAHETMKSKSLDSGQVFRPRSLDDFPGSRPVVRKKLELCTRQRSPLMKPEPSSLGSSRRLPQRTNVSRSRATANEQLFYSAPTTTTRCKKQSPCSQTLSCSMTTSRASTRSNKVTEWTKRVLRRRCVKWDDSIHKVTSEPYRLRGLRSRRAVSRRGAACEGGHSCLCVYYRASAR